MKKTALVMLGMFAVSSLGFAQGAAPAATATAPVKREMTADQKAKWEAMKKDREAYKSNVNALVDKYNKASDADKPAIRQQLTDLVSAQTDKGIAARKDMAAKSNANAANIEKDKTAFVNKKVDALLSRGGQEKMQEMKDKGEKQGKKEMRKGRGEVRKMAAPITSTAAVTK